ncbi:hypothetical protein LINPERHAP2_LOCUS16816, partial [Linum perenne]
SVIELGRRSGSTGLLWKGREGIFLIFVLRWTSLNCYSRSVVSGGGFKELNTRDCTPFDFPAAVMSILDLCPAKENVDTAASPDVMIANPMFQNRCMDDPRPKVEEDFGPWMKVNHSNRKEQKLIPATVIVWRLHRRWHPLQRLMDPFWVTNLMRYPENIFRAIMVGWYPKIWKVLIMIRPLRQI